MNIVGFQTLRAGMRMNASPATARALSACEDGLRRELTRTGLFDEVEVGRDTHPDRLVVGLCTFGAGVDALEVAAALEGVWSRLVSDFWEAHAFLTEEGHVELQGATLDRASGRFVTVHLVAQGLAPAVVLPAPLPVGDVRQPAFA